jgi:hypothetical protein
MTALFLQREVFNAQSMIGEHIVHGRALASALGEPAPAFEDAAAIFFRDRFVVGRGQHRLKKGPSGGHLSVGQTIKEVVSLPAFSLDV